MMVIGVEDTGLDGKGTWVGYRVAEEVDFREEVVDLVTDIGSQIVRMSSRPRRIRRSTLTQI
jgi:hypothetical protein